MPQPSATAWTSVARMWCWCAVVLLLMVGGSTATAAADQARTTPPQPAPDDAAIGEGTDDRPILYVSDWLVHFTPSNKDGLTRALTIRSTLPSTFPGNRTQPRHATNLAQPIGLVTFRSKNEAPTEPFEVRMGNASCAFRATWPGTPYTVAPLSWAKLTVTPSVDKLATLPADHWVQAMRSDDTLPVKFDGTHERMLLYDVDITHSNPVDLTMQEADGQATLKVTATDENVRAILVITPMGDRWRLQEIAGEGELARLDRDDDGLTHDEAVAKLREFVQASELPDAEVEKVTRVLRDTAMWKHQSTVISRINEKAMDTMMPLRIRGVRSRQTRAGFLVTVINRFIPNSDIDALVKQLGDDAWRNREAAEKALIDIGHAASKGLTAAKSDDIEVRHRVSRIQSRLSEEAWLPYPPSEAAAGK